MPYVRPAGAPSGTSGAVGRGAPTVAPGRRVAGMALLGTSTLLLTVLEAVAALVDEPWLADVRAVLAGVILVIALLEARPLWRALAGGFVVLGALLIAIGPVSGSVYEVYRSGVLTVTPVVALLVSVTRLNAVVLSGRYNLALAAFLSRRGRTSWSRMLPLYLAYLLSPVLLAGALAQSYGPFQQADGDADRRLLAVCVRALSLGLVWSPMAAPTAFALTLLDVPVTAYLAIALPASLLAFVLLLVTTRGLPVVAPAPGVGQDPAKVLRLLIFLVALPLLVGVLAAVRGHVDLQVVLLGMLTVTVTWAALDRFTARQPEPVGTPVRHPPRGLAAEGVALYLSLGVFVGGVRLVTSDGFSWAADPTTAVGLAFVGSAACFLVGVHPVAVIAVLSPTVLALDPGYAAVAAFALCAGAQAVNVSSPFSPLSVVGSQLARTTPWEVSSPVHWRFSLQQLALYGAVCAVALGIASPTS